MAEIVLINPQKERERIFLATADSVVHDGITNYDQKLSLQIKLLIILGYEVVTGAPFVWQSESTLRTFQRLAPLYEAKLVGLMGRPGVLTATDYLEERKLDTSFINPVSVPQNSPFRAEIPSPLAINEARKLDSISSLISRSGSVQSFFERFFIQDLEFDSKAKSLSSSIRDQLPTKFSSLARRRADSISNDLANLPNSKHFSRALIEGRLMDFDLPKALINIICNRSTGLFHAANSLACDARLFTTYQYSKFLPENIPYAHQLSLAPSNPYLLLEVLKLFGVSRNVIDNLSIEQLRKMQYTENEVSSFSSWYKSFINNCVPGSLSMQPPNSEFKDLLMKISIQRNSTLKAESRLKTVKSIEKKRMDWVLAALAAFIGIKLGIGPAPGTISKNAAKWSIDYFRKRCERAINKPLGEFEAMIIREGLRDIKPLVV